MYELFSPFIARAVLVYRCRNLSEKEPSPRPSPLKGEGEALSVRNPIFPLPLGERIKVRGIGLLHPDF